MSAGLATTLQRTHLDASASNSSSNTETASMSKLSSSGLPVTPTGSINNYPIPSPALSMGSSSGGPSNRASNRHASLRFGEGGGSQRNTNRYSVTALYSMAAEQDTEIEDELARGVSAVPVCWTNATRSSVNRTRMGCPSFPKDSSTLTCCVCERLT